MAVKIVQLTVDGQTYDIPLSDGVYTKQITAPSKSSYGQPDHVYAMALKVEDTAGNVTTVDKNHATFGAAMKLRVKEKVAPVISISKPGAGAYLTNQSVAIEFTVTDNDSGVNPDSIKLQIDSAAAVSPTRTAVTGGYKCTYTTTLSDGKHTIKVNASDYDGNAATQALSSFTVDTVPPSLNITAPPVSLITNKQSCTVSGDTNDATSGPVTVKITLNGTDQGAVTVNSSGAFSKALTLAKGTNTIVVRATDKAGKYSEVSRTVVYDPDAPVIVKVEVQPNPVGAGEIFTVTVEATD